MEKTSKIKSISSKQSQKNLKRYSALEMEDWTKWTISHDKEGQYTVWQELKYKTQPTQDDPTKFWISEIKDKKRWGSQPRDYRIDLIMKALECAVIKKDVNIQEAFNEYYDLMDKKYLSVKQPTNG